MAMQALLRISQAIDAATTVIGRAAAWAVLGAVVVSAGNALGRRLLGWSSNAWFEMQWALFGLVFLLCASWTLNANGHIRIDVVANALPKRAVAWIEVIGSAMLLLPICLVMMITGWPFFWRSFVQAEQSLNPGGLPLAPLKLLVPLGFTVLFAQGVSQLIKGLEVLRLPPGEILAHSGKGGPTG